MKIRSLLVDDEPLALEVIQSYIANCTGLEVVGVCKNAIEALDVLHNKQVDLIFLDIKMPKLLGTELLKSLTHPPKVIFVTAYRDFAMEGYELDVVDYLLKPVSFNRFLKAVSKVKRLMGFELATMPEESKINSEAFVYMKVEKAMQKVLIDEILFVESKKDYVKVYLNTGKSFLAKQSITSMVNLLSEQRFLRVHRSFIISIDKISGYTNTNIQLGSIDIPIGRLYKQHVMEVIATG